MFLEHRNNGFEVLGNNGYDEILKEIILYFAVFIFYTYCHKNSKQTNH